MDVSRPEHYFRVALERIKQAEYLYFEGRSYALAMYVAGVAVESMLRAFRAKISSEFESRRDVLSLFAESSMLKVGEEKLRAAGWSDQQIDNHVSALQAAVSKISIRWHNTFRFASEERLLAHFKRMKFDRGIKGDILKSNASMLINAANVFIKKGVLQWS